MSTGQSDAVATAEVSLDGLELNGRLFYRPVEPMEYSQTLGVAPRIVDPSPPAPYSHRNNQIHIFDEIGIYLIEHHATRLIDAVTFVLWLEEAVFKPAREFQGQLTIGGVRFFPGMMENDYVGGTIAFEGPVLKTWKASRGGIWIGITGQGIRGRSGSRGRRLRLVDVEVCFDMQETHSG